jgi:hypothetical protein
MLKVDWGVMMNRWHCLMACIAWCLTFSAAAADAQGTDTFASDYDRDVYCAASSALVGQSSSREPDIKAMNYWLSATTSEGKKSGLTAEQNSQAVDKKVEVLQNRIANGQEDQVRDTYRRNCRVN